MISIKNLLKIENKKFLFSLIFFNRKFLNKLHIWSYNKTESIKINISKFFQNFYPFL